jgi:hypothetical protein
LRPSILTAWTVLTVKAFYHHGENMENREEPRAPDTPCSGGCCQELKGKVDSLSSLVCDLLKTNQELRDALIEARAGAQRSGESTLSRMDEISRH